jgi:hypothetical protein
LPASTAPEAAAQPSVILSGLGGSLLVNGMRAEALALLAQWAECREDALPHRWIETIRASIESVVPSFSAHRMVRDYVVGVYLPAAARRG